MWVAHGIHQGGMLLPIIVTEPRGKEIIIIYTSSTENFDLFWQLLCYYWSPFYYHGLTLIPAWIRNYIHYNVWHWSTHPFWNFNGATYKFENAYVISSHALLLMWLLIHASNEAKPW